MLENKTIGFMGAGNMATALIKGLLSGGIVQPENVLVTDKDETKVAELVKRWNINASDKVQIVAQANIIVVAVKPADVSGVMEEIGLRLNRDQVIISVAAGIPTSFLEGFCEKGIEVIRVMPNTSCTVLASATAIARGKYAGEQAESTAAEIFMAVGKVEKVEEEQLDAITGLSGSGPAYFYYMVEAMERAGERLGLPREMSLNLAVQTMFGAAKMLLETKEHPEALRKAVTSPGGTTFAGLQALAAREFEEIIYSAIKAATERSKEMRQEFTGV